MPIRLVALTAVVLSGGLANALAQEIPGQALFTQRCASCHVKPDAATRAPSLEQLRATAPESILATITKGSMAPMALGLSPEELDQVAEYAAGRALSAATPAGSADAMPNRCAAKPLGDPFVSPAWNGWGVDIANTRFQPTKAAGLTADSVPKLTLKWAFGFPNGRQAYGQPNVVGARLYVGSDTGVVYSLDAATGCVYWSFQAKGGVRTAITIAPVKAAASKFAAFFGDLRANVYAIDAETGAVLWTKNADKHPVARITGAPQFHDGRLYVPVSSVEEAVGANPKYPCCTFRGSVIAYDAETGDQIWQTFTISEAAVPMKKTSLGTQTWGPAGAAVWSAPTIDPRGRRVYVSTSNGYTYPAANTTNSVMALDLDSGTRLWTRQLTPNDAYLIGCGQTVSNRSETCPDVIGPDFAIGTSPILRALPNGSRILSVGQKSGVAWGIDPETGNVVWQHRVGRGSPLGGIEWGGAADEHHVYYPNADGLLGLEAAGGLAKINLATGERVWWAPPIATCTDHSNKCIPAQSAAASAIPGVVFSGATDGMMRAYDARDGKVIWEFATAREFETTNGVAARGGSINGPGPTIVNGMVYFVSGYGSFGQMAGNVLLAFGVQ